jgi:hypothetical protein
MNPRFHADSRWIRETTMMVGAVATALALQMLLRPSLGTAAPLFVLVCAVGIVAWNHGARAGLAATFLASIAATFFLLPPIYSLRIDDPGHRLQLILFTVEGVALSCLCEANRRARRARQQAAARERIAESRATDLTELAANCRQDRLKEEAAWRQIAQALALELRGQNSDLSLEMSEYARLGGLNEAREPVRLEELVQHAASSGAIAIRGGPLPVVQGNAEALGKFFRYLTEHAGVGAQLSIAVSQMPGAWVFTISANHARELGPQDARSLVRLAICRRLVENQRGRFWESGWLAGRGACVFSLPRE